jgi:TatD DNase family protein
MLIDTHCHLDAAEFVADRDALVFAARSAGVGAIVVPSVDAGNWEAVHDCCQRFPGLFPAYGIHPLYVDGVAESAMRNLREWLAAELKSANPPVAVGEIGLDFFMPGHDAGHQEAVFIEQLKIARDFDLPVLLHVRRSVDGVLKCLRRIRVRGGIAHAFNGSREQADEFIRLGFKLGFGGTMTYSRASRIRELATSLPLESIVLETDAPDIPPSWLASGRNTPVELARIAGVLSGLLPEAQKDAIIRGCLASKHRRGVSAGFTCAGRS